MTRFSKTLSALIALLSLMTPATALFADGHPKTILVSEGQTGVKATSVTFEIKDCGTSFGQNVYVIGDLDPLGNWHADKAFPLKIQGTGANAPWKGTIKLPAKTAIQYKYILWDGKTVTWEADQKTPSKNREIMTPASGDALHNDGKFDKPAAK